MQLRANVGSSSCSDARISCGNPIDFNDLVIHIEFYGGGLKKEVPASTPLKA